MIAEETRLELLTKFSDQRKLIQEMLDTEENRRARAENFSDRELARAKISKLTTQLNKITTVIDRLENGEYDRCTSCGSQISTERLTILTLTTLCKTCAAKSGTDPG